MNLPLFGNISKGKLRSKFQNPIRPRQEESPSDDGKPPDDFQAPEAKQDRD